MAKIIILRGNSGSGKSTVALAIQEQLAPHPVLIEHDHFRRKILKEHEGPGIINDELIFRTVQFALENNRDVIIEGIMWIARYKKLFDRILEIHPSDNYFYYFDIPFEETLRRHATKKDVDFGENEMRLWFKENNESGYPGEVIIPAANSFDDTVSQIITEVTAS
jgi:adenylate kinase family enzyme